MTESAAPTPEDFCKALLSLLSRDELDFLSMIPPDGITWTALRRALIQGGFATRRADRHLDRMISRLERAGIVSESSRRGRRYSPTGIGRLLQKHFEPERLRRAEEKAEQRRLLDKVRLFIRSVGYNPDSMDDLSLGSAAVTIGRLFEPECGLPEAVEVLDRLVERIRKVD